LPEQATIHSLPGSGAAPFQEVSPYGNTPFDPRSLYIFIAGTEPVREAAASVNMSVEDFFSTASPGLRL